MIRRFAFLLLALIPLVAVFSFLRYRSHSVPVKRQKVFLIGLDGASWNLMEQPLREGKLPNIKKLMQTGTYGPLKTLIPTKSPVLWTSIATGKTQLKHGIGNYTAQKDGKIVPVSGVQRVTKAYWNILSDYGFRVGVVNWWVTWPAEKVNGYMVSDRYRDKKSKNQPNLTYPPDLIQNLPELRMSEKQFEKEKKQFGLPQDLHPTATSKVLESLVRSYKGYWVQDKEIREASKKLVAENSVDVFGVVFRIIDVSSHLFWTYINDEQLNAIRKKNASGTAPDKNEIAKLDQEFARIMLPIYQYADLIVGDFLQRADAQTSIIICSDHGFKFEEGRYGHSDMKEPPDGVIILNGPYFRKNFQVHGASLLDITPTLLYLEGIPLGRDMDGKPLFAAFDPSYVKTTPPRLVQSHDHGYRQRGEPISSETDKDVLDDFRSLGYIH